MPGRMSAERVWPRNLARRDDRRGEGAGEESERAHSNVRERPNAAGHARIGGSRGARSAAGAYEASQVHTAGGTMDGPRGL
jgi:hypothetical protein